MSKVQNDKAIKQQDEGCGLDGHGLWSLDPLESKIHQEAQSKLDKGECIK